MYILVDSVATEDELHTYTVEIATTGKKLYIAVHVMYITVCKLKQYSMALSQV